MLVDLQTQRAEVLSSNRLLRLERNGNSPTSRASDQTLGRYSQSPRSAIPCNKKRCLNSVANEQIHIFAVPESMVKPFNSDTVTVIANFARLRRGEQNLLLGKKSEDTEGDANPWAGNLIEEAILGNPFVFAMTRLYQFIRLERPSFAARIDPKDFLRVLVVEPQQSFERVRAQAGAFLLSEFHEQFDEQTIAEWSPDLPVYHHYTLAVAIRNKDAISEDLATFSIMDETMFPGLDQAATAIVRGYQD